MANTNKNYNNKGNFNFGRISGGLGNYSHFNSVNGHSVINFTVSVYLNGKYQYIPMIAWGQLAKDINSLKPKTTVHLKYSLQLSKNTITTKNGYNIHIPQIVAFKPYAPKSYAEKNTGKLAGNFSKFSTYKLVGKNSNRPMLHFKLSSRDYRGEFHNYSMVTFGRLASIMHQNIHFKDYLEVAYSLSTYKINLKNGHSLKIPSLLVNDCSLFKTNSNTAPANKKSKKSTKPTDKKVDISDDDLPF